MDDSLTTPDEAEEHVGEALDSVAPARAYHMLPLIGLGGSAGSIPALQTFLQSMPEDPGLAFVVILHLSPDHDSELADILQRSTSLRVLQVRETCKVQVNTVYVIPPGKVLRTYDGFLQLADLPSPRHGQVTVDLFFRMLADTHGPHATAIVLSGMDGDGAIGIKRIKERGGLTIAQDPDEAEHSSMPRSALATGMVDWTLPAAAMPGRLLEYYRLEHRLKLPSEKGPPPMENPIPHGMATEAALRDVLIFLRTRTGRDFAHYKRATILRRIGRRMQVNGIADLPGYLDCLRTRPGEAGALLQDLLISVTNFFRDGECFSVLEAHIGALFAGKGPGDSLRVWVAACATGEEAYSIAILLSEYARKVDAAPVIQVFASDLDDEAIGIAREGLYPTTIEADVSEERLRRYFVKEHRGYRLRREIREMVLFAVHDVLKDSPFSRLDLVTCRNLLIYLNRNAQHRVFDTFHFSLKPRGLMFLGSSESVEDNSPLFAVLDKKHRIYSHRPASRSGMPGHSAPGTVSLAMEAQHAARSGPVLAGPAFTSTPPASRDLPPLEGRSHNWGELHFRLLEKIAPPSVLIDAGHDIVHLSPNAGEFLRFQGGEPSRNLLRAIHEDLRIEVRAALYQAAQRKTAVETPPLAFTHAGGEMVLVVRIVPFHEAPGFYLVIIQPASALQPLLPMPVRPMAVSEPLAQHLEQELERMKLHLRDTVEQYEVSTEELKASNEELQAMNEELRSATEELETSREELQSINEELTTVNHELKSKVDELGHSNSDMHNLMDATAIATVFLDRDLCITRFTPSAITLFKLIPTDIGRPLSDLATHLDYPEMTSDARRVLERLVPMEREVGKGGGQWFLVRALPYRTLDDRIAGVVLTFVDITERKHSQEALRVSQDRFSLIVSQATAGVMEVSLDGRIEFTNRSYRELLGYSEAEIVGMSMLDLVHPDDRAESARLFDKLARHGEPFQVEKRCLRKDGSVIWTFNNVSRLSNVQGRADAALVMCTDVTERKRAEEALSRSEEQLRLIVENAVEFAIFSTDPQMRVTRWNVGAERLLGYPEAEVLGQPADIIFTDEDRALGAPQIEVRQALTDGRAMDDRLHRRKDGSTFWASGVLMPMLDDGAVVGFVKILRDQSRARQAQEDLETSRAELVEALRQKEAAHSALEAADAAKDRFLAVLSHELRNPLASIRNAAEALQSGQLSDRERAQSSNILDRQSAAMKTLLDDLLDVSRLRLGRLTLHRRRILLSEVVDMAIETTKPAIEAGAHRLEVVLPHTPVVLDADPVRLSQVLSNLLANAAKYTPQGGHIGIRAHVDQRTAVIAVTDNGIGMEAGNIHSMFGMFVQETSDLPGTRGLGIGLALVRSIVELHGGLVEGSSSGPGQGSTFTVRLPLAQAEPLAPLPEPEPPAPLRKLSTTAPKVLVADDNADAAWSIATLLQISGCEVSTCSDGPAALEAARQAMPDVAVLDIGMPGMSGHEVARQMRALPGGEDVQLIALTGWGQEADRNAAAEAGFDAHMVKPVEVQKLVALIEARQRGKALR
ncbi:PAS domain S-box protein [Acidovorax sp. SUPP2825]|uniref:PAS domain S-box protein n=1 Tax=Acidovorax sp. SUPP2825 TaxID=2920879 RepID=UPI0023DE4C67|nr:PAS domain S-box protein [Acidovorax sp. SUPP2825]GKS96220.1 PAS domain S-box protein [Acidovorax sp. SUPP2825]